MNREERRKAAKQRADQNQPQQQPRRTPLHMAPVLASEGKPGLLLSLAARALLSRFVLKRVSHPQVLALLLELARQAGRMDAIVHIQMKQASISR